MTLVFIAVFVSYGLLVIALNAGWIKAIKLKTESKHSARFVTVIIATRNEEANIGFLLDDLVSQEYPRDHVEVILVDDHSEDKTRLVVEEKIRKFPFSNLKLIQANDEGKKSAITTGIGQAMGEVIVTTDADCRMGVNWLQSSIACFDNTTQMVFGPVKIEQRDSLFSKMQSMEFLSLVGSGAATMAYGIPTMCNGANLAFRREVFHEVSGFEGNVKIASGDDEFLMRKIAQKYPHGIRFNNSQESVVTSIPQQRVSRFISQRLRWAGKWKHHQDFGSKLLAVYVFLFHAMVLSVPVLYTTGYLSGYWVASGLLIKLIVEFMFLYHIALWLNIRWHWPSFLLLQLLYSVYAVGIGIASLFLRASWKGRK